MEEKAEVSRVSRNRVAESTKCNFLQLLLPLLPSELPFQSSTSQNTRSFCYKHLKCSLAGEKGVRIRDDGIGGQTGKCPCIFPRGFGHRPSDLSHFSTGIWSSSFRSVAEGTKCSHKASEQECRAEERPRRKRTFTEPLPCAKHTMCQTLYACQSISLSGELFESPVVGKEPGSVKLCHTTPHKGFLARSSLGPRTGL